MDILNILDELNKISENLKALSSLSITLGERTYVDARIMSLYVELLDGEIKSVDKILEQFQGKGE